MVDTTPITDEMVGGRGIFFCGDVLGMAPVCMSRIIHLCKNLLSIASLMPSWYGFNPNRGRGVNSTYFTDNRGFNP